MCLHPVRWQFCQINLQGHVLQRESPISCLITLSHFPLSLREDNKTIRISACLGTASTALVRFRPRLKLGFCFHFYVEQCHTACKSVPGERQIRTSLMLIATPKVKLNHKVFRPVIIVLVFTQDLDTNTAVSRSAQLNIIYWLRLFKCLKITSHYNILGSVHTEYVLLLKTRDSGQWNEVKAQGLETRWVRRSTERQTGHTEVTESGTFSLY